MSYAEHYQQHVQAADQLAVTYMPKNRIAAPLAIAADTSYVVASYLIIDSNLTVAGNLLITG